MIERNYCQDVLQKKKVEKKNFDWEKVFKVNCDDDCDVDNRQNSVDL